jgi:hypothetical protein
MLHAASRRCNHPFSFTLNAHAPSLTPVVLNRQPDANATASFFFGFAYDLFVFKPGTACIVRVRQTAYRIDPDAMYEDLIPRISAISGRCRTRHGSQENFGCEPGTSECGGGSGFTRPLFLEIDWWKPDDYINPHSGQATLPGDYPPL